MSSPRGMMRAKKRQHQMERETELLQYEEQLAKRERQPGSWAARNGSRTSFPEEAQQHNMMIRVERIQQPGKEKKQQQDPGVHQLHLEHDDGEESIRIRIPSRGGAESPPAPGVLLLEAPPPGGVQ